jgi:hypothetical protein
MGSTLRNFLIFGGIATGSTLLAAAIGMNPGTCPAPSARSVDALFAPCLAGEARYGDERTIEGLDFFDVPGPAQAPRHEEPAVARSAPDVNATGSVAPR